MNIEQVRDFTLSLPGVTEDQPFGDDNITFRVEGKIFLCLWLGVDREGRARFACKLSPDRNEELRDCYEGIMPAFHWNKKHWSDICYESFETTFVCDIIRESYRVLLRTLPKAVKLRWEEQLSCLQ